MHGWGNTKAEVTNEAPFICYRPLNPHFEPAPSLPQLGDWSDQHSSAGSTESGWGEGPPGLDWSTQHKTWLQNREADLNYGKIPEQENHQPPTCYFEWLQLMPAQNDEALPPSTPPSPSTSSSSLMVVSEVSEIQQPCPLPCINLIKVVINLFEEQEVILASYRRQCSYTSWEER